MNEELKISQQEPNIEGVESQYIKLMLKLQLSHSILSNIVFIVVKGIYCSTFTQVVALFNRILLK